MKTITLTFVIDDDDEGSLEHQIQNALEQELNSFPLFGWFKSKPTKKEVAWRKIYDNDR